VLSFRACNLPTLGHRERLLGLTLWMRRSLAPQSIFQSADGVLHFALELISFAFTFELAIAGYLSNNFLHFAFGLLGRALDAIFVHRDGLQYLERSRIINRHNCYTRRKAVQMLPQVLALDRHAVRRRFEQRFSSARMAADYVALYRSLLKRPSISERETTVPLPRPVLEKS
jgi:hypothetical protein